MPPSSSPFDADALARWAAQRPFVRRVWVFGSRAKNTHHPDSDLDVAIEIDPVGNDEDVQTSFIADVNRWTCELNHATGLSVDLNHYDDKDNDSKVLGYVDDHGLLVFQRGRRA